MGFDLHTRTVGIVGTGKIGQLVARILSGFGCRIVAHDPHPDDETVRLGVEYLDFPQLLGEADIITLHIPLTPETHHLMDRDAFRAINPGAMLVNTSRGALVDTEAAIDALKDGRLGTRKKRTCSSRTSPIR